jgi:hypothetical protein
MSVPINHESTNVEPDVSIPDSNKREVLGCYRVLTLAVCAPRPHDSVPKSTFSVMNEHDVSGTLRHRIFV